MAILAGSRELIRRVIRVHSAVVISLVTTNTSIWRVVVIPIVAGGTIVGNGSVCPVQWIIIIVDREGRRFPARGCSVAHSTIRREHQRNVIWIETSVIIRRMTARTGVWGIIVIPIVAGIAIICDCGVGSGQRVECIVVKSRRHPGRFGMAILAGGRELVRSMVRIQGAVVISLVTAYAGIRCVIVISVMAYCTIIGNGDVRSV